MFAATSGYRNDGDGGLIHVGARYYDPLVGRFITRDTILSQHAYLYCNHNPVNYLDPTGHMLTVGGDVIFIGGGGLIIAVTIIGSGPPGWIIGGGGLVIIGIGDIIHDVIDAGHKGKEIEHGRPMFDNPRDELQLRPALYPDIRDPHGR